MKDHDYMEAVRLCAEESMARSAEEVKGLVGYAVDGEVNNNVESHSIF